MTSLTRCPPLLKGFALAGGLAVIIVCACGPSENGTSQACHYDTSGNWPFGANFHPNNPASSWPIGNAFGRIL
ncbi:MAG: hypothetical protein ABR582_15105 [Gemmatimonadaceae bacterium]